MGNFGSTARVSVESLEKLQAEIKNLSTKLSECYTWIDQQMKQLSDDWQDYKYDEFEDKFNASKKIILEISERYLEFADKYLQERIDILKDIYGTGI